MTVPAKPIAKAMLPEGDGADLATDNPEPLDWAAAEGWLRDGGWCWLATVRPDGAPHAVPVFAVWSESAVFVVSKDTARKSRNLAADGRCVITKDAGAAHVVVEGTARQAHDRATLERASEGFERTYSWPTTVAGDRLDAPYGAPTSGGPPYCVFEITPTKAFAFPPDGTFMPTRWHF